MVMNQITSVDFHGDAIFAVEREGRPFVAIKPICMGLGLDWKSQFDRLQRDPILAEGMVIMTIPSPGGPQETTCLPLDLVHGWLFTIDHDRVRPDLRDRVLLYKRECYRALAEHFGGRRGADPFDDELILPLNDGSEALRLAKVREARLTFGRSAARALWLKLELDLVPEMTQRVRQYEVLPPRRVVGLVYEEPSF